MYSSRNFQPGWLRRSFESKYPRNAESILDNRYNMDLPKLNPNWQVMTLPEVPKVPVEAPPLPDVSNAMFNGKKFLLAALIIGAVIGVVFLIIHLQNNNKDNDSNVDTSCGTCGSDSFCNGGACVCRQGYTGNGIECADVDECTEKSDECDANAFCANTAGSFACSCNAGFTGDGLTCTSTHECRNDEECVGEQKCVKSNNDVYVCECGTGFAFSTVHGCLDINECETAINDCATEANCTNTVGSYTCKCPLGFTGDGKTCTATITIYRGGGKIYTENTDPCNVVNKVIKMSSASGVTFEAGDDDQELDMKFYFDEEKHYKFDKSGVKDLNETGIIALEFTGHPVVEFDTNKLLLFHSDDHVDNENQNNSMVLEINYSTGKYKVVDNTSFLFQIYSADTDNLQWFSTLGACATSDDLNIYLFGTTLNGTTNHVKSLYTQKTTSLWANQWMQGKDTVEAFKCAAAVISVMSDTMILLATKNSFHYMTLSMYLSETSSVAWATLSRASTDNYYPMFASLDSKSILIIGGYDDDDKSSGEVYQYDFIDNSQFSHHTSLKCGQ